MTIPDLIVGTDTRGAVALPINPFVSNRYHFGMLLGVADLEADQGYHRGKTWLHNAWLHGPGTVWGLGVEVRHDAGEVVVAPGLALDGNGRELWVPDRLCLDLGRWFAERRPEDLEVTDTDDGGVRFTVHVRLCTEGCLDRPVPSISEPCEGSDLDTAYSRTVERAVPDLVAGPAPADPVAPYLRLRQLAGQLTVTDGLVQEAVGAIAAADTDTRAAMWLAWFRRLAALDTVDLAPADGVGSLFPSTDPACIPLADVAAHLRPDGDRWVVVGDGDTPTTVDNGIRPAHVRTRTVQELLAACCGLADGRPDDGRPDDGRLDGGDEAGDGGADDGAPDGSEGSRGGGSDPPPRLVAGSGEATGSTLRLTFTGPLVPSTVDPDAFTVTALRASGWTAVEVAGAELDDAGTTATLRLGSAPRVRPLRVVARGAGPAPLLGTGGRPLSGVDVDGRTVSSGEDAALMVTGDPESAPAPEPATETE